MMAGSIRPIWFNGSLHHFVFTDATGVEYRLDQNNSGIWTSIDGSYVAYDSTTWTLHFPDGSFWNMNVVSSAQEQDAGTQYPSMMEDTNGNQVAIQYAPGIGLPFNATNSSSRITNIFDARTCVYGTQGCISVTSTFGFNYNSDPIPHATSMANGVGSTEYYTFTMAAQSLLDPFASSSFGSVSVLQAATATGPYGQPSLNIGHQFLYNSFGELTQVTAPLGGILKWDYATYAYAAGGRSYREVQYRYLKQNSSATQYTWTLALAADGGTGVHGSATLTDASTSPGKKVWTFSTNPSSFPGLATTYEEQDASSTALVHKDYTWTQNGGGSPVGSPYVGTVVTTLNPTGANVHTKSVQTLDNHGNLTQSAVYDFPSGTSLTRTYSYNYLTTTNYTSQYIFNRLTSASVSVPGSSGVTIVTNSYDGSTTTSCASLAASSATYMHDSAYSTSVVYRGNLTQRVGLNGGDSTCFAYDSAGVLVQTISPTGTQVALSTDYSTSYSLPTTIVPNSNTSLQATMTYASSFAVTQVVGPNSATGSTSYDVYGRPYQTVIPDGATTTYTYSYSPTYQVATVNNKWRKTTLDGFGRTIQVDSGHDAVTDANTVSRVVTQYAPCACSPLLKIWRVSQPYNPNTSSAVWTTYTYDATGRTISVLAPDGASTSTQSYSGNSTTITDAAGKWKTSTKDAFGNLTLVTEPNPAGGSNWTTTYTYNLLNQMTQVYMPRPSQGGTQTRTFAYTGADMTSTTNPENGTVTYTYDNAHRVLTRTDALSQQTQYTYDAYGRISQVSHGTISGATFTEDLNQQSTYTYDAGTNGMGHLTSVQFGRSDFQNDYPFTYTYAYTAAGRVSSQTMSTSVYNSLYPAMPIALNLTATYQWDNEGKMTSVNYPSLTWPGYGTAAPPIYALQYDNVGRLNGMTADYQTGYGPQSVASASYGAAGQVLTASYYGIDETRTYNSLLQLTRITSYSAGAGGNVMDIAYNFSATANNGRILSSNDYVTGENVSYSYDAVNRLSGASAGSLWAETYNYDGFGNLTAKNAITSPAPTLGVSYDANNHQIGLYYDANGNQTMDAWATTYYGWNVENRLSTTSSTGYPGATTWYSYDPSGKRVMKDYNPDPYGYTGPGYTEGTWEFYFYGITGQRLATVVCNTSNSPECAISKYDVYFGGKRVVSGSSVQVTDRLGSVRATFSWAGFLQATPQKMTQTGSRVGVTQWIRGAAGVATTAAQRSALVRTGHAGVAVVHIRAAQLIVLRPDEDDLGDQHPKGCFSSETMIHPAAVRRIISLVEVSAVSRSFRRLAPGYPASSSPTERTNVVWSLCRYVLRVSRPFRAVPPSREAAPQTYRGTGVDGLDSSGEAHLSSVSP
jgi:YD repeat-containing protein